MTLIVRHKILKWVPAEKDRIRGGIANIRGIHFHLQDTSQICFLVYVEKGTFC